MGVCETLLPDVVAPEAHQNDHSYVHELSGPTFDSLHKNWAVTRRTKKNPQNCQISRVCACVGMAVCPGQYGNPSSATVN